MVSMLEAVYADGWDHGLVCPIPRPVAETGDAAGDPYTVLLLADGRLTATLDISWGEGYCLVSRLDPGT